MQPPGHQHARVPTPLGMVKLKKVQNAAAARALSSVLRTQLRGQPSSSDEGPSTPSMEMIRALAYSIEKDVDLSRRGLTDRNMVILCSILTNHPTVRAVDLSFNPITELSAPLFVKMIRASPRLHHVNVTETHLSSESRDEIQRLLRRNTLTSAELSEQRRALQNAKARDRVLAECRERIDVLNGVDRRIRREVVEEWLTQHNEILRRFRAGRKKVQQRDQHRTLLRSHATAREAFILVEEVERKLWASHEALSVTRLFALKGIESEVLVSQAETNARRLLRQSATAGWREAKKRERNRLNAEAHVRYLLEAEWMEVRDDIMVEGKEILGELKEQEQAAFVVAERVLRERLAKEEAERVLRRQEELRLEKENQLRIEREVRRLREFAILQDREARAEAARRSTIEREESGIRSVLADVKAVDKRVYEAYASLMRVERARTSVYKHAPVVTAQLANENDYVTHMLGGVTCSCSLPAPELRIGLSINQLLTDVDELMNISARAAKKAGKEGQDRPVSPNVSAKGKGGKLAVSPAKGHQLQSPSPKLLSLNGGGPKRPSTMKLPRRPCTPGIQVDDPTIDAWDKLEVASKHWRKTLRFNENEAKEEIKENESDWLPVLYPQLPHIKHPSKIPAGTTPSLCYDPEMFAIPQFSSETLESKLAVLAATIVIKCSVPPSDVQGVKITGGAAEPHLDRLLLPEEDRDGSFLVAEDQQTITLRWENETTLVNIEEGIALVKYVAGSSPELAPYERCVVVDITAWVPALDPNRANKAVIAANPWGARAEVHATLSIPVAVVPPVFHFPALPLVQFYEGFAPDRCSLTDDIVPMKPVARVEKCATGGFVFPNPAMFGITYDEFTLSVRILNHSPDDIILLKVADEADISIANGPNGQRLLNDGACFGEITEGYRLQKTAAIEEGTVVYPSNGFRAKLHQEAKPGSLARLFRRLRYYNGSSNPDEGVRDIEFALEKGTLRSFFIIQCEVIGTDDPACMTIAHSKMIYRQNSLSVPDHLRKYLRPVFLPIFDETKVEDIDTSYFNDGELIVTIHNALRGDELMLLPTVLQTGIELAEGVDETEETEEDPTRKPTLPNPETLATHRKSIVGLLPRRSLVGREALCLDEEQLPQFPTDRSEKSVPLYHNGVPLGTLLSGTYCKRNEKDRLCCNVPLERGAHELRFRFGTSVPLPSVQWLLRSVVYYNAMYMPPEGTRTVSIRLVFGESCDKGEHSESPPDPAAALDPDLHVLEDQIELRVAPALMNIPGGQCRFEYREGSGHVRIAPFDLVADKDAVIDPITGYHGGSLWVEVMEGLTDEDVLGMKLEDHMKLEQRRGYLPLMPTTLAHTTQKLGLKKDPNANPNVYTPRGGRTSRTSSMKDMMRRKKSTQSRTQDFPAEADPAHTFVVGEVGSPGVGMRRTRSHTRVSFPDDERRSTVERGTMDTSQLEREASRDGAASVGSRDGSTSAGSGTPTKSSSFSKGNETLRDRMRDHARDIGRKGLLSRQEMMNEACANVKSLVKKGLTEVPGSSVGDIWSVAKATRYRVATYANAASSMFLKFAGAKITRKEVKDMLKGITYANTSSDASVLSKVLRVTLRGGLWGVSQAIVSVDIQSVNDVTEFELANCRPRYAPFSWGGYVFGAWSVAPFGKAELIDPDTSHFDGGCFVVELQGGCVKGDTTGLLNPSQQKKTREYFEVDEDVPLLDFADGKVVMIDEAAGTRTEIGTVEYPKSAFGATLTGVKVTFHENEPQAVSLKIASYLASCVTFATAGGKALVTGQRAFQWKIRDAENPLEGKQRVLIDVAKPIVVPPPVNRTAAKNAVSSVIDRAPTVHLDTKGRESVTQGFVLVLLVAEDCPYVADPPADEDASLSFSNAVNVRDGGVYCGSDYIGKPTSTPSQLRIDFGWASKVSSKSLGAVCAAVRISVAESPTAAGKKVIFHVSDGQQDCCFHVMVAFK